jgi:hypothetical protein
LALARLTVEVVSVGFGQRFAAIRRLIVCTNSSRQAAWATWGDAMPGGILPISTAGRQRVASIHARFVRFYSAVQRQRCDAEGLQIAQVSGVVKILTTLVMSASLLLAGCSTNQAGSEKQVSQVSVIYRSDPPGATLTQVDGRVFGQMPVTLSYQVSDADRAKGEATFLGLTAHWPSGAKDAYPKMILATGKLSSDIARTAFTFKRPQDAPHLRTDLNHARSLPPQAEPLAAEEEASEARSLPLQAQSRGAEREAFEVSSLSPQTDARVAAQAASALEGGASDLLVLLSSLQQHAEQRAGEQEASGSAGGGSDLFALVNKLAGVYLEAAKAVQPQIAGTN